jgi:UDP-GlcNAc:undecaprenyl-phosphate/decaprenyl-phosphate GlcNAc-1-phosphate transferase
MLPVNLTILYLILLLFTVFISKKLDFYDKPNVRKIHNSKVFNAGGIIIYVFYLIIVNFFELNHNFELIISIGFFICMIGFIDDRINLNPSIKILFIIIPSIYLILNGISIYDLGNYEYIGILSLGKFQLPFLILSTGLLINATNYIDGIDGLLLTFFTCCLVYYIFLIDDTNTIYLLKLFLIPVVLNLIMNLLPYKSKIKIFSGNTGSLFIGFFISFSTIELYNSFSIHPVYLIWPLWYPVYDFLFVSTNRAILKKSIFSADNSHLHHKILTKFKKNHLKTILLFFISNVSIIYLGFLVSNFSKILSLIFFIIGFIFYFTMRFKFKK